jgi:hypothetical protein
VFTRFVAGLGARNGRGREAVRAFALLAVALLVLHHLRYALARLSPAEGAGTDHVHGYLPLAEILVVSLCGLAFFLFIGDLARARRRRFSAPGENPPNLRQLWLRASSLLLMSYVLQEALESALSGQPVQITNIVVADQGWLAFVLAALLGLVVALLQRGARAAIRLVERSRWVPAAPRRPRVARWTQLLPQRQPRQYLVGSIAGRAPPQLAFAL